MSEPGAVHQSRPTKIDNLRENELYRYFQPTQDPAEDEQANAEKCEDNTLSVNAASSPDTTLTALAQLCAIRLDASRAMISVIDREKQYFIAEATRTIKLSDTTKYDADGDSLWAGCSTVDKSGRLCEKTIELPVTMGQAPCFTVTDLSADERFNELPFVTGYPHFRFYAGTPLTTRKGINIGSLFVIDDRVRPRLKREQEEFLGTMAQIVMKHMEITSEAEERKKVSRMSMGLNAFVEGKSHFDPLGIPSSVLENEPQHKRPVDIGVTKALGNASRGIANGPSQTRRKSSPHFEPLRAERLGRVAAVSENESLRRRLSKSPQHNRDQSRASRMSLDSDESLDGLNTGLISADSGHRATCARAANLLCESLDLKGPPRRGGVVFYDTTSRPKQQVQDSESLISQQDGATKRASKSADVMSQAADDGSFLPLDEDVLSDLIRRFPNGKIWTFDVDGNISSSEDDPVSPTGGRSADKYRESRAMKRQREAAMLQYHFPKCKQLLFTGFWDAAGSRWFLGGFAWTTSRQQIFSVNTELNFFRAFGNSIMAEVSRLASIAADRQKADFIGSISHEFRSPLHGILASAEFLAETKADTFQKSLVDTISSCGRTLLDTINHILDYSKINSFEQTWRNVRKPGNFTRNHRHRRGGLKQGQAPPMLNIYASTDVAAVTEEVIEGVYAGQMYQDISSIDATDFSKSAKSETRGDGLQALTAKPVDVILEIPHDNYRFITQPGALKRVIMNIFGNALKYTQRGSILVQLSLDPIVSPKEVVDEAVQERMLQITVKDSGKGISKEYIRTSLFNPFCQEDALASGTGLGLSIVKSIVTMLNGTVEVQSEVGVGTKVIVRLPLPRIPGTDTQVSTPTSALTEQTENESISSLQQNYITSIIALYGFESESSSIGHIVKQYVEDWYGLRTSLDSLQPTYQQSDLVILEERAVPSYLEGASTDRPLLILSGPQTNQPNTLSDLALPGIVEYMATPFGPHKLARGILACLDRSAKANNEDDLETRRLSNSVIPAVPDAEVQTPNLAPMTLETVEMSEPIEVETDGTVTGAHTKNAQMALHSDRSSATLEGNGNIVAATEFPFTPVKEDDYSSGDKGSRADDGKESLLAERRTGKGVSEQQAATSHAKESTHEPARDFHTAPKELPLVGGQREAASNDASSMAIHDEKPPAGIASSSKSPTLDKRPPRLLLVDDNKINLRLLETFMKKRKYEIVDSAENGQMAVEAVASHHDGYDIIFMDISMPVMNGFEATRVIRDIEDEVGSKGKEATFKPALIIALTGLASGRDQTEAFTSGVDLFMTKPVSFKEVGRLLDNWEQHGSLRHDSEGGPDGG